LAIALGALLFAPRRPRPRPVAARGAIISVGILLGALVWRVAPAAVQGDGLFHLARVRKLVDLGSLHVSSLNELVHGGLHPGYAFPLWHAFLAAVAKLAGVDPTLVVQHESSLLVPLALLVTFEAGTTLFRSPALGAATVAAQVSVIAFAPGHGGSYSVLDLPATASRQLLVPAVLALVFMHVTSPSWKKLASTAAASLALALTHPTYALFICVPLGGWLVIRSLVDRRDARPIAEALAAVVVPSVGVALALLPVVRQTISHNPSRKTLDESLAHYVNQIDLLAGGHYRLAPAVFARSGAVAVAALVLVPVAALAWRRRWASFVLGGSLAVLALLLTPFLFEHLSNAVSLSQSRRAAGFLPFAFAFAGGFAALAGLLGPFVVPLGLAAGIVFQSLWPGDFGYTLEQGGPTLATWIAAFGGAGALVGVLVLRPREFERRGALAAFAACLFTLPVIVHGFAHWSPSTGQDAYALTPGLVAALRHDVPKQAVVFSDLETSYRIAAEAPVLVYAAPPAHVADTTRNDPYGRREKVLAFLSTGNLAIPRGYGARWLVIDRTRPHPRIGLRPVYADARYSLYAL
jgi:hypothetical protein